MRSLFIFAVLLLCGCASDPLLDVKGNRNEDPAYPHTSREYELVCRAAIAAQFNRPLNIIRADPRYEDGPTGPIVTMRYIRPDDNTMWVNRAFLRGNQVVWATETGRWRVDARDEVITYEINRASKQLTIRITYGPGSVSENTFEL